MDKLLSCPFCGAEPKIDKLHNVWCDNDNCAIVGNVFSGGARHWNRRAALQSVAPIDEREANLNTIDAKVWTDEFCRINPCADWGTMIGWFANAIMAGFDEATRRAALSAPAIPTGYAIVPIVPTEKMLEAALVAHNKVTDDPRKTWRAALTAEYAAMLAAAPIPADQEEAK